MVKLTKDNGAIDPWAVLGWGLDLLAVTAIAFVIGLSQRVTTLERWQSETQGSRWTASDHAVYATAVAHEIRQLREEQLVTVNAVNVRLERMDGKLDAIKQRIAP